MANAKEKPGRRRPVTPRKPWGESGSGPRKGGGNIDPNPPKGGSGQSQKENDK